MCRELVDRANAAGGHDNVTALVIAVGPAEEPAA
jgi:serine/threonine protein phosphatase PrpC